MPNATPLTHVSQCAIAYAHACQILGDVENLCGKDSHAALWVQKAVDRESIRLEAALEALAHDLAPYRLSA